MNEKVQELEEAKKKILTFDEEIRNLNVEVSKLNDEVSEKKLEVYRSVNTY